MSALADMAAALVIAGAALWGVLSGTDVFQAMLDGVAEGLRTLLRIFPSLVALLTAVYMLRASGALELAVRSGLSVDLPSVTEMRYV